MDNQLRMPCFRFCPATTGPHKRAFSNRSFVFVPGNGIHLENFDSANRHQRRIEHILLLFVASAWVCCSLLCSYKSALLLLFFCFTPRHAFFGNALSDMSGCLMIPYQSIEKKGGDII
ncbi:hypothetical protein CDAR_586421 [Caerostris darwini]|uniref:Uncharacterized protein n=1 Tax=Caerostris darwini TaxID=1538125 RepID=A0AAV4QAV6_9ARAC|nr:hypothetical protein CDAR_586421 [Caerostris darwini]